MTRIVVSRTIPAPHQEVWEALADLGSHPRWMRDARRIVFTGDQRRGVGTRMEVETAVGPLRTIDVLEVVGWDEGESIVVAHQGLIRGEGTLRAQERDGNTIVSWIEVVTFPWWLGGAVTAWLARPALAGIWRGNLQRLEALVS